MYELIILSLLMRFPSHGYLIAKIANDMVGPWTKISNGTLYPLLTRLEQTGLITRTSNESGLKKLTRPEQQGRTFMITNEGRERFHEVMMDTTSNIGEYQRLFHLKVAFLDLLPPRERLHLLNHYINYCDACILHMKTHSENLVHELAGQTSWPQFQKLALNTMQQRARTWQSEVDWTMQLREQVVAQIEQAP
jgi:DNA-binding PadR family transcriptional regulator